MTTEQARLILAARDIGKGATERAVLAADIVSGEVAIRTSDLDSDGEYRESHEFGFVFRVPGPSASLAEIEGAIDDNARELIERTMDAQGVRVVGVSLNPIMPADVRMFVRRGGINVEFDVTATIEAILE